MTWHDRSHGWAGPWRSGWRRSADLDRESLRESAAVRSFGYLRRSATSLGGPRRSLTGNAAPDGVDPDYLWRINAKASPPDLAVILDADPAVVSDRLRDRGPRNRLQKLPSLAHLEWHHYREVTHRLTNAGWTIQRIDCSATTVDEVAHIVARGCTNLKRGKLPRGSGAAYDAHGDELLSALSRCSRPPNASWTITLDDDMECAVCRSAFPCPRADPGGADIRRVLRPP